MYFINMIPPKHIVISGGGVKVFSFVGALKILDKNTLLRNVKEYCGVSAGAWLSFMLAAGVNLAVLEKMILDMDFGVIRNMTTESLIEFPETFGFDNGENLIKLLTSITRVVLKLDPNITFGEFSKVSKCNFRCWATDLNILSAREFSSKATPDVKILDALRASMSLPLYFTPTLDPVTGNMLTDGGIQGNLPLHMLSDEECETALALGFSNGSNELTGNASPQDLAGFINSILCTLVQYRNEHITTRWKHRILRVPVDEYASWNFEASRDDRKMLLEKGESASEKWVECIGSFSRKISRRHSG